MTILIKSFDSTGKCTGKCDASCYDAKHPKCTCICNGANHGVGQSKAVDNTQSIMKCLLESHDRVEIILQLPLFEMEDK